MFTSAPLTSCETGRRVATESPKSPCSARHAQVANCTGSGLSNPYAFFTISIVSAFASGGSTVCNGSPGAIYTSMKHTNPTPNAIGSA